MFVSKALEAFLDDREAGDDLVQFSHGQELKAAGLPEDFDLDGRVDEEHRAYPEESAAGESLLISERSPSQSPEPASSRMRPARWRRR